MQVFLLQFLNMKKYKFDISVITINYNNSNGLKETLKSVKNQVCKKFEYIIIDGSSTDDSLSVIEKYKENINVIISEKDNGIYHAMNKGVKVSNGKYVLFLNSGDSFFSAQSILNFYKYINQFDYDFFYGDIFLDDNKRKWTKKSPLILSYRFFVKDSLPFPCTLIKKSVIEENNYFDENLRIVSDWKFFILSYCKLNKSFFYINEEPVVKFKLDGISNNYPNIIIEERAKVLKDNFKNYLKEFDSISKLEEELFLLCNNKIIKMLIKLKLIKRGIKR